jgi:hypothetical protein
MMTQQHAPPSPLAKAAFALAFPPATRPQATSGGALLAFAPPRPQTAILLPRHGQAHALPLGLPHTTVMHSPLLGVASPTVQTAQLALASTLCRSYVAELTPPSFAMLAGLALTPQTSPLKVTNVTSGFSHELTLPMGSVVKQRQGHGLAWQLSPTPALAGLPKEFFMTANATATTAHLSLINQCPMLLPWQAVTQLPVAWQRLLKQAMAKQLGLPVHRFGVRAIAGPVAMGWQRLSSKQYQERTGQALPQGQGAFTPVPCATPHQAGWWVLGQRYPTSARQSLEAWLPADALPTVVKGEAHAST